MFSKTAQYAFKILIFMQEDDKELFSAAYIHEQTGIPYKYLTMLMTKLSKHDLLIASRGRYGGFVLARESEKIFLIDILNAIDENNFEACVLDSCVKCEHETPCAMHSKWIRPKDELLNMMNKTSVSEFKKADCELIA